MAIPVLGEQILNTFVGLFDTYLAGNLRGDISIAATSAVGLAAYVGWLASMIVMLVGIGATALIARHEGADDHPEANHFANQSMTLGAILGVGLMVLFYALAPWLARYCHMTGVAYDITVHYLRVDALGYLFMSITLVGSAALRGVANMRTPMLIFTAINAFNVVASLTLVYGLGPFPQMGVSGIVAGTLTARTLGAALMLIVLIRGGAGLKLHRRELPVSRPRCRRILRIGIPAAADGAIMWSAHFVFLAIIARLADPPLGPAYFAAHIVAVRVAAFTYLPSVAWSAAAATMIGQALGAREPSRARRAGHESVFQGALFAAGIMLMFYFGAELIFKLMTVDPLVRAAGVPPFRVAALLQPCLAVSIIYIGGLRGAGDTRFPLLISIAGALIRISFGAFFGLYLGWGLLGAWMGMFADIIWRATAATLRFLAGKWVQTRV